MTGADSRWDTRRSIILLLAGVAFMVNAAIAWTFAQKGAFGQTDAVFDIDAYVTFNAVSSTFRHPLVNPFLLPARLIAWLAGMLGQDAQLWRTVLVLAMPPVAGIFKTLLLASCLKACRIGFGIGMLILLLDACSMARLIFYSLPESFTLAGIGLQLLLLAFLSGSTPRVWLAAALLATGATVTNAAVVLGVWLVAHVRALTASFARSAIWQIVKGGAVVAVVFVVAIGVTRMVPRAGDCRGLAAGPPAVSALPQVPPRQCVSLPGPLRRFATDFFCIDPAYIVGDFPRGTIYGFTGPLPELFQRGGGAHCASVPPAALSILSPRSWSIDWLPAGLLVFAALLLGVTGWLRESSVGGRLVAACFLILGFNALLHTVYSGGDSFLYVMHWQPAVVLLLAGIGHLPSRLRTVGVASLVLLCALQIVQNARIMSFVFRTL